MNARKTRENLHSLRQELSNQIPQAEARDIFTPDDLASLRRTLKHAQAELSDMHDWHIWNDTQRKEVCECLARIEQIDRQLAPREEGMRFVIPFALIFGYIYKAIELLSVASMAVEVYERVRDLYMRYFVEKQSLTTLPQDLIELLQGTALTMIAVKSMQKLPKTSTALARRQEAVELYRYEVLQRMSEFTGGMNRQDAIVTRVREVADAISGFNDLLIDLGGLRVHVASKLITLPKGQ